MATIVDVIFVGTGTSGAVPNVSCLTDPKQKCKVCTSAMTPAGQKNMKKNTSMIVRYRKNDEPNRRLRYIYFYYYLLLIEIIIKLVFFSFI